MTFPPYFIYTRLVLPGRFRVRTTRLLYPLRKNKVKQKKRSEERFLAAVPAGRVRPRMPLSQSASEQLFAAKHSRQTLRYRVPSWSVIFALIRSVVLPQISHAPRAGPLPARYSA